MWKKKKNSLKNVSFFPPLTQFILEFSPFFLGGDDVWLNEKFLMLPNERPSDTTE